MSILLGLITLILAMQEKASFPIAVVVGVILGVTAAALGLRRLVSV